MFSNERFPSFVSCVTAETLQFEFDNQQNKVGVERGKNGDASWNQIAKFTNRKQKNWTNEESEQFCKSN